MAASTSRPSARATICTCRSRPRRSSRTHDSPSYSRKAKKRHSPWRKPPAVSISPWESAASGIGAHPTKRSDPSPIALVQGPSRPIVDRSKILTGSLGGIDRCSSSLILTARRILMCSAPRRRSAGNCGAAGRLRWLSRCRRQRTAASRALTTFSRDTRPVRGSRPSIDSCGPQLHGAG
jgi:hypothetical protein